MYQVPSLQSPIIGPPTVLSGDRQHFSLVSPQLNRSAISGVPSIPPLYPSNMSRLPTITRLQGTNNFSAVNQRIISSRTTNQPIQILTPKIVTTSSPITISTSQNVLSSQVSTVERPFNVVTTQHVQTPTGTYQIGRTIQPAVKYEQVRTVTPKIFSYSRPATITSNEQIMVRQPANVVTTQNIIQAVRPPRIISTSQPVITPVGTSTSAIQDANNFTSIIHRAKTKGQTSDINYIMGINNLGAMRGDVNRLTGQPLLFQQPTLPAQNFPVQALRPQFLSSAQPLSARLPTIQTLPVRPLSVQVPSSQALRLQPLSVQVPSSQTLRVQPLSVQVPSSQALRLQPLSVQVPSSQILRVQSLPSQTSQVQALQVQSLPVRALQARSLPAPTYMLQPLPAQTFATQPLRTQLGQPISIRTVTTRTISPN